MSAAENLDLWLALANALMLLAAIVFLVGLGFGWLGAQWRERRAASRRQRTWLRARQADCLDAAMEASALLDAMDERDLPRRFDPRDGTLDPEMRDVVRFYNSLDAGTPGAGTRPPQPGQGEGQ